MKTLSPQNLAPIYYLGKEASEGPLPAFFYFSISGEESLTLDPYNTPATFFGEEARVFSWTIPGHGEGENKFHAMQSWSESLKGGKNLLQDFFQAVKEGIHWLVKENIVDPNHLAVGGLSRGAFVALHVAALVKEIKTLVGFAPLISLEALEEFSDSDVRFQERVESLSAFHCIPELTHLHHLRLYIGNRDTKVSTKTCFTFLSSLAEEIHAKRAKRCSAELYITPSIGMHGHGTAPHTFEEGTLWMKQHLMNR